MDNLGTGGNRDDMGKNSPRFFGGNEEKTQEKLNLSGEAKVELGSKAAEMFGTPEAPDISVTSDEAGRPEVANDARNAEEIGDIENVPDFPEMMPPEIAMNEADTEFRPLAEDGSTEGKIDKDKILTFGGDLIDKESQKQVERAISKYKNDPFELDNIRNEMMADGLRDNYGRIFGNDTGADDAPEGEQAEGIVTSENKQTEVIEFSEMAEGKVA